MSGEPACPSDTENNLQPSSNEKVPRQSEDKKETQREGLRQKRKSTEFFQPQALKYVNEDIEIYQGKGDKLEDIPNVAFRISKLKVDANELSLIHNLAYKKIGKITKRRKNVLQFSGLPDSMDSGKKTKERLDKVGVNELNSILSLFDIARSGPGPDDHTKSKKIERLAAFLQCPKKMSDRDIAREDEQKKEKKRKSQDKKRGSIGAKRKSNGVRRSTPNKQTKAKSTPKKVNKKEECFEGDKKFSIEDMDVDDKEDEKVEDEELEVLPKKNRKLNKTQVDDKQHTKFPSNTELKESLEKIFKDAEDINILSNAGLLVKLGEQYNIDFKPIKEKVKELALDIISSLKSQESNIIAKNEIQKVEQLVQNNEATETSNKKQKGDSIQDHKELKESNSKSKEMKKKIKLGQRTLRIK